MHPYMSTEPEAFRMYNATGPPAQMVNGPFVPGWHDHIIPSFTIGYQLPDNSYIDNFPQAAALRRPMPTLTDAPSGSMLPTNQLYAKLWGNSHTLESFSMINSIDQATGLLNEMALSDARLVGSMIPHDEPSTHTSYNGHLEMQSNAEVHLPMSPVTGNPFQAGPMNGSLGHLSIDYMMPNNQFTVETRYNPFSVTSTNTVVPLPENSGRDVPAEADPASQAAPTIEPPAEVAIVETKLLSRAVKRTTEKTFTCSLCHLIFYRRQRLEAHENDKHRGERPYRCHGECGKQTCVKKFASQASLNRHHRPVDKRHRYCDNCGMQVLRQNIARHQQKDCRGRRYIDNLDEDE